MAVKILSVDDEADLEVLLTHYFRRKIRKGEYEFVFARNGLEAQKIMLEQPDIDIILSDINMPEMDGLTLLTKINELRNPAQKCIMVSAYGDMKNIRTAMNRGAFDFATKPIDMDDLALTIEKAIGQIEYVKSTQKEHCQLESIQNDLAVATEIQQAILPRLFPPFPEVETLDIYASMHAAKEVGGDFYDFFRLGTDRIGFIIADVSGKGVPAALFMAVSNMLVRSIAQTVPQSNTCINEVNKLLCKTSVDSMFVTLFYGIIDYRTGKIDYTNAGHNPPYILHKNGEAESLPYSQNFIAGVFDDIEYRNDSYLLKEGDALVLYTDGITEAFNTGKEQFGENRLKNTLCKSTYENAESIITEIYSDLSEFVGEAPQSDDITLMIIRKTK